MRVSAKRLMFAVIILSLVQTGSSSPTRADGALVPERPIQPGGAACAVEEFTTELLDTNSCTYAGTLNFVFRDDEGELYIGGSAHAFSGERNKARVPGERDAFGKVVFESDSLDPAHPGSTTDADALDFALIRIDEDRYPDVDPRVRYWGGPTGYTTADETHALRAVVAYGNGGKSETSEGNAGPREGHLLADSPQAFTSTVNEVGGDSGMPYVYAPTGEALGVNANCACGGLGYYPTVEYLLDRLAEHGWRLTVVTGQPGAELAKLMTGN